MTTGSDADRPTSQAPTRTEVRGYLVLILIGAAIGVPAALLASLFLALVHELEELLWTDLPDWLGQAAPPWYLIVGLPVAGATVVWVARRFLPGDGGHSPLEGIGGGGVTPLRHAPGIALAAIGTLAFGAVLGPEAPLIALGSAVGALFAPFVRLDRKATTVLATAGSFSAISALFGGPLVAGFMLLEVGVGAGPHLITALMPGLVAAAVGYVLFVGLGDWSGLHEVSLAVPHLPEYEGTHLADLVLAIGVGVLTALVLREVRQLGVAVDRFAGRVGLLPALLAGGLAVGLIAQFADLLGADYDQILFSGQAAVPSAAAESSVGVLLVILVAKCLGYGICLGCGFRGGPVFPAIFIGIVISTFAVIVFDTSPTWAIAVGAAAGMGAGTDLVFSALLFSMLLVGHAGLDALPAAVLAMAAAWLTKLALPPKETASADTTSAEPQPG
ncbi:MAG: chloride channel protein [Nocardioidaceae bacterium]